MHALITRAGTTGPVLADVAPTTLGPTDLRIRVAAAAVNPVDTFVATEQGRAVFGVSTQAGLGWDLSGTIAEVGDQVTGFAVGDRVAAIHDDLTAPVRAHAESVVVPAAAAAVVPDGVDLTEAASIPLNALTARQALHLLGPANGRSLLVTGAAGAVGGYAVALASREGWRVTGLARRGDVDFVRGAGAEDVLTELPGATFDAVLDTAALQDVALSAARDRGDFVGVMPAFPVESTRGVEVATVGIRPDGQALSDLLALHADGTLTARVAGVVPLRDAATAYDKVAGGGQRGRWLLLP